jgi:hypothetical protein
VVFALLYWVQSRIRVEGMKGESWYPELFVFQNLRDLLLRSREILACGIPDFIEIDTEVLVYEQVTQ